MCLAAPGQVIAIEGDSAVVDYGGVRMFARLDALGEPVKIGDYLLVHAGFAIRRLAPDDGAETLRLFDELAVSVGESRASQSPGLESAPEGP